MRDFAGSCRGASRRIEVRETEVVPLWSVAGWRAHRERARELSTKTGERAKALAGAVVRQAHHERMRGLTTNG
jgi:hypothetical protein